jgi:mono/diheme cytochrome c family protein
LQLAEDRPRSLPAARCLLVIARCLLLTACCLLLLAVGCRQQMADQPSHRPLTKSTFFGDDRSGRPLEPGTVAQGFLRADERLYTGKSGGELVTTLPVPLTTELLQRGRERFDIYCAPCHDRTGGGRGMIVQRGFRQPPSLHADRLRQAPVGRFVEVIASGFGVMPDYAEQVRPADRWAIAAYIRALQLSQSATLAEVPPEARQQLQDKKP